MIVHAAAESAPSVICELIRQRAMAGPCTPDLPVNASRAQHSRPLVQSPLLTAAHGRSSPKRNRPARGNRAIFHASTSIHPYVTAATLLVNASFVTITAGRGRGA